MRHASGRPQHQRLCVPSNAITSRRRGPPARTVAVYPVSFPFVEHRLVLGDVALDVQRLAVTRRRWSASGSNPAAWSPASRTRHVAQWWRWCRSCPRSSPDRTSACPRGCSSRTPTPKGEFSSVIWEIFNPPIAQYMRGDVAQRAAVVVNRNLRRSRIRTYLACCAPFTATSRRVAP
jgi:hypothetical protein